MNQLRLFLVIAVFGLVGYLETHDQGFVGLMVMIIGVIAFILSLNVKEKQ